MPNNFKSRIFYFLLTLITCANCRATTPLRIVSTTTPIASLAKMVGGEHITLNVLQRSQGCPHHYQITPTDFDSISNADLVLAVSAEFETYMNTIAKRFPDKQIILLSAANITPFILSDDHKKNWHIWLHLDNATSILQYFTKLFSQISPDNKEYFHSRLDAALARITMLRNMQSMIYRSMPTIFIWSKDLIYLQHPMLNIVQSEYVANNSYSFIQFAKEKLRSDTCLISSAKDYKKQISKLLPHHTKVTVIDGDNWKCPDSEEEIESIYYDKFTEILKNMKQYCS